jgi:hypothetical protein
MDREHMAIDPTTDLVRVPVKADSGKLFYVTGCGNIGFAEVNKARVCWREGANVTSFLRNRNLRSTPQACRGLLCVFDSQHTELKDETETVRCIRLQHESESRTRYRLGVVAFLQPTTTSLAVIYEWIGGVGPGLTPQFLYEMRKSEILHFDRFKHHFREVRMKLSIETKGEQVLHFVNMVSTPTELHKMFKSVPLCTNPLDSCYEMLASGPDKLFHAESMPKLGGFGKPIRINSCWDILLKKRKRLHGSWKDVPHWLRPSSKTVHDLPCDVYACCSEDPMGSSEKWNKSVQNLLAILTQERRVTLTLNASLLISNPRHGG